MKLTKKVLSLILAAALLVGTVAVAANAAEALTQYAGSVMSYYITSDKDVSDGNAEVKPGETITVTVSMTTNFHPGTSGGETIFWTKGFFESDTPDVVMDDVLGWWKHTTTYPVTSSAAYPSDCPMDTYVMYLNNRAVNTDMTGTETYAFNKQTMYTITFQIPDDAEVGSTAIITLPASKLSTATQTGRNYTMCQSISGTTTLSSSKVKAYAETVNVDSLQITVVSDGGEEPPVVEYADLTALQAAIAKAATADTANCTYATVTEFEAALAAANALNVETTLKAQQPDVDAAAQRLEDAITGLKKLATVDYSALEAAKDAYEALSGDAGNYSNWDEYAALYVAALEIDTSVEYDNEQGTIQAAVDAAAKALNDFELVEYGKVNYDALNDAIAAYEAKVADKDNYSNWADYEALYNAAKAIDQSIVYDKNGEQKAADDAAAALNNFALVEYAKVNYDALNDAIAAYEAKVADKDIYSNWADYEALYNEAKAIDQSVVYDKNGEQAAADAAAEALADFVLVEYAKVDYTALNDAIAAYEA